MLNKVELSNDQLESLSQFTKYIWWKTKDEILEKPYRLIAQVMNIGTIEDIFLLKKLLVMIVYYILKKTLKLDNLVNVLGIFGITSSQI